MKSLKSLFNTIGKRPGYYFIWLFLTGVFLIILMNIIVIVKSKKFIYSNIEDVPQCYTGIVLGALVSRSGTPSDFLQDRIDVAIELYRSQKIKRFLLTGDHGQKNYDEVNSMKTYLLERGICTRDIFLDHAGFDTYNSMIRAKKIFEVNDAIVITQEFHLPRAIFIARSSGIKAVGIKADKRRYSSLKQLRIREILANIKAFIEVAGNKKPKFLGEKIPIYGDSKLSYD